MCKKVGLTRFIDVPESLCLVNFLALHHELEEVVGSRCKHGDSMVYAGHVGRKGTDRAVRNVSSAPGR